MAHKMTMHLLSLSDYEQMREDEHFGALDAKLREAGLWHGERRAETTNYQDVDCRIVNAGEDVFGRVSGEDRGLDKPDNPGDEY